MPASGKLAAGTPYWERPKFLSSWRRPGPVSRGLCPRTPRIYRLTGEGSLGYNALAAEEDRAPAGTDPFVFAQGRPERLSGGRAPGDSSPKAVVPAVFPGRCPCLQSDKSQGGWGTGPPGLGRPLNPGTTHRPTEANSRTWDVVKMLGRKTWGTHPPDPLGSIALGPPQPAHKTERGRPYSAIIPARREGATERMTAPGPCSERFLRREAPRRFQRLGERCLDKLGMTP